MTKGCREHKVQERERERMRDRREIPEQRLGEKAGQSRGVRYAKAGGKPNHSQASSSSKPLTPLHKSKPHHHCKPLSL